MNCKKCNIKMKNFNPECDTLVRCNNCGEVSGDPCLKDCEECGGQLRYNSSFSSIICGECGNVANIDLISKKKEEKIEEVPEEVIEYPSLMQQASNFVGAMGDYIKSGMKNIDDDKYNKRLEICASCPAFDASQGRCKECGCFMKVKAKMEAAKCPLNKWEE